MPQGFTGCRHSGSPSASQRLVDRPERFLVEVFAVDVHRHVHAAHARQLRRALKFLHGELGRLHRQHDSAEEALRVLAVRCGAGVVEGPRKLRAIFGRRPVDHRVGEREDADVDCGFSISRIMISRSTMSGWKFETSATPGSVIVAHPFLFLPIFAPLAAPSSSRRASHSGGNQWAWTSIASMRRSLRYVRHSGAVGLPRTLSQVAIAIRGRYPGNGFLDTGLHRYDGL